MKAAKLPPVSEAAFMAQVFQFAAFHHWMYFHTHDSRHSASGFPDVVFVRERVIWAELKRESGRVSPEQKGWLDRLQAAGQEVYLWRPSMWGEIEAVLGAD
jgi:hypothetical protein